MHGIWSVATGNAGKSQEILNRVMQGIMSMITLALPPDPCTIYSFYHWKPFMEALLAKATQKYLLMGLKPQIFSPANHSTSTVQYSKLIPNITLLTKLLWIVNVK